MSVKAQLRKSLLAERRAIRDKKDKDKRINDILIAGDFFSRCDIILFYAPTSEEIDITPAINIAYSLGKRVAFPRCVDKIGNMEFYFTDSYEDLIEGTFGIKEPQPDRSRLVDETANALCIVPALSSDLMGYRIGYGKGYYDRFLQKNRITSVALCYNEFLSDAIPFDEYDQQTDYIITDCNCYTALK